MKDLNYLGPQTLYNILAAVSHMNKDWCLMLHCDGCLSSLVLTPHYFLIFCLCWGSIERGGDTQKALTFKFKLDPGEKFAVRTLLLFCTRRQTAQRNAYSWEARGLSSNLTNPISHRELTVKLFIKPRNQCFALTLKYLIKNWKNWKHINDDINREWKFLKSRTKTHSWNFQNWWNSWKC